MTVPGYHNIENAVAASAVALQLGVSPEKIRSGLSTYRGVKRRFEYIIEAEEKVFIDDYAHHPAEIEAFLKSVRALYPGPVSYTHLDVYKRQALMRASGRV